MPLLAGFLIALLALLFGVAASHGAHDGEGHDGEGHDCVFDQVQRVHRGHDGRSRRLHESSFGVSAQEYRVPQHTLGSGEKAAEMPEGTAGGPRFLQNSNSTASRQKIRITADTSFLDGPTPDPFACQFAGQAVQYTLANKANDTHNCTAQDVLDSQKRTYLKERLLPAAVDFLTSALSVFPVQGNLSNANPMLDGSCFNEASGYYYSLVCCQRFWPDRFVSTPNSDFLLILTARPIKGTTPAFALECQSDQYYRPTSAYANVAPSRISMDPSLFQRDLSIFLHELFHALGFSGDKTSFFRNPADYTTALPLSQVVYSGYDPVLQKDVKKIITPKVVAAARAHYGCHGNWTVPGMELEDGGDTSIAFSHWEKRIALNEIMSGTPEPVMYTSAMTLAFFEDSGFYGGEFILARALCRPL